MTSNDIPTPLRARARTAPRRVRPLHAALCVACLCALTSAARSTAEDDRPTLDETRVVLQKWIETQQILSKERNDWSQGREILTGRLELLKRELGALDEKIAQAEVSVAEAEAKRAASLREDEGTQALGTTLAATVTRMEGDVRRLLQALPDPLRAKLTPLTDRIPADPAQTKASLAERFQNVLGILNEIDKANGEIAVHYEVKELGDGRSSEVRALYVGLAHAYYVSANNEAGVGVPSADGWKWTPNSGISNDVLMALDILQGKHTPAFVPLPVILK